MSFFLKELIRRKLKQLTAEEIFTYAKQYHFSISPSQANQIANYLKNFNKDPFTQQGRQLMFQELEKITDYRTAQAANKLLDELINSYGLEHLFE